MFLKNLRMRMLALAVILVAGCAATKGATPSPDPRFLRFEQQSQKIDESENRCISETVRSSNRQLANMTASAPALVTQQTKELAAERDHKLLECRAKADRERDELTATERADYQNRVQQQRDNNFLMTILTTSAPR
jgi:hypothetical protein